MLARLHPVVRRWFKETFGKPSDPQREGWPAIASGAHTLILAPTGTGKTLAAFLWELNELIVRGTKEPLSNAVHLLYISPLKATFREIWRGRSPNFVSDLRQKERSSPRFASRFERVTRRPRRARECFESLRTFLSPRLSR